MGGGEEKVEGSDWGGSGESDFGEHEEGGSELGGSSEFWGDDGDGLAEELETLITDQSRGPLNQERPGSPNRENKNKLDHFASRDASEVLRDINRSYWELKELPGQGEYSSLRWQPDDPNQLRTLYLKNGWPDNFDGEAFMVDLYRADCADSAKLSADEPLRGVGSCEQYLRLARTDIAKYEHEVMSAATLDEAWSARFQLWSARDKKDRAVKNLQTAKTTAAESCPGGRCQRDEDLPLWEYEQVRLETEQMRMVIQPDYPRGPSDIPELKRRGEIKRGHDIRKAAIFEKALVACKADAELLCPGRTFADISGSSKRSESAELSTRIQWKRSAIENQSNDVRNLKSFLERVPDEATQARTEVEDAIENEQRRLEEWKSDLEEEERALAERGDTE